MSVVRAALIQLTSSDDPTENLGVVSEFIRDAAGRGAQLVATPEVTNMVSMSRTRQREMLRAEADDETLPALAELAEELSIWLLIGSLALKGEGGDDRFMNRSFLIGPDGSAAARYDKIHMFDAAPGADEAYRESSGYRPGDRAVLARTPVGAIGMTICYDMRFPALYERLARTGAQILTAPSAFTCPTGAAHWETLLRARAIETGCFVLAPAQCGEHRSTAGRQRATWGHSLAISPWGEVLADGGDGPGVTMVDMALDACAAARRRVPSLLGARVFSGP